MTDGLWLAGAAVVPAALDGATEERLLNACERLVQRIGFSKTSMADIARAAGVSRGTLYRYFDSREALFDALGRRAADRFFQQAAEAMDAKATLAEQAGQFSQTMTMTIHPEAGEPPNNQVAMVRMLASEGAQALRRTAKFLRPYIQSARDRGEVRADLDVADASEWLARMLLSFTIFQGSMSYEADDPASVSSFVQRYAIHGLTGSP
jgi:AcrR family transcriptional regulator